MLESADRTLTELYSRTGATKLKKIKFNEYLMGGEYGEDSDTMFVGTVPTMFHRPNALKAALAITKGNLDDMKSQPEATRNMMSKSIASIEMTFKYLTELKKVHDYPGKTMKLPHSNCATNDFIEGVVRHEFGHAFHVRMKNESYELRERQKYGQITRRAGDGWLEAFAENFALYSMGKKERMHKDMMDFFDRYFAVEAAEKRRENLKVVSGGKA